MCSNELISMKVVSQKPSNDSFKREFKPMALVGGTNGTNSPAKVLKKKLLL